MFETITAVILGGLIFVGLAVVVRSSLASERKYRDAMTKYAATFERAQLEISTRAAQLDPRVAIRKATSRAVAIEEFIPAVDPTPPPGFKLQLCDDPVTPPQEGVQMDEAAWAHYTRGKPQTPPDA